MEEEKVIEQVEQEVTQDTPTEQPVEAIAAPPVETPAQMSFRQLREKAERLERERDEYARQVQRQVKPQPQEEPEDDFRINPDDLVEGKHLTRYEKKLKKLEEAMKVSQKQSYDAAAEHRVRTEMPDFDKIVTQDTLYILQSQFPELAASINSNPDLYSKAKAAHQAITKLGITPDYSSEQNTINKNVAKPKPLASIAPQQGDSPLTRANAFASGLTDDMKRQLYEEMKACAGS
jgi:hypothetical protein